MYLEEKLREKVYIDESNHEIYKKLKDELKLFPTMKDLFLVAASIGFKYKQKEPLKKKRDIFSKNIFDKERDIPFLYTLALADKKDKEAVFLDVLSIAEEYANAGIKILEEMLKDTSNKKEALDEFIIYLMENYT